MKQATLCLLIRESPPSISLGLKQKKVCAGKYVPYGGYQEDGEPLEEAARRELREETGVEAEVLELVGELTFVWPEKAELDQKVYVYRANQWRGEVRTTEPDKIVPEWFPLDKIPYERMMPADQHWLPKVLQGQYVVARFVYNNDSTLKSMSFS